LSIAAIGSIAAAGIGAAGSLGAGAEQAGAAKSAQQLEYEQQQQALQFQEQEWNTQQQNEAPFLQAGQGAVKTLSGLLSTPGQGLLTPWTQQFNAPTAQQAAQTPGEQFELQQGEQAINNSAAASGGLLSGGTAKSLDQYANNVASTNYQQAYNNALGQYQQNYNIFENNQANEFNRYAALAGAGQTAASTLGQEGQQAASNISNISLTGGQQQAGQINNAAAATASGYAGAANAFGGGANNLSQLYLLSQLLNQGPNLTPNQLTNSQNYAANEPIQIDPEDYGTPDLSGVG
jgi:hypothetical protein